MTSTGIIVVIFAGFLILNANTFLDVFQGKIDVNWVRPKKKKDKDAA